MRGYSDDVAANERVGLLEEGKRTAHYRAGLSCAESFTVGLFIAYAAPTVVAVQLGLDPDAAFWIGRAGLLALALPVLIVALHVLHALRLDWRLRAHSKWLIMIGGVLPAVLLCFAGAIYSAQGNYLYVHLSSGDCTGFSGMKEKPALQAAYAEALEIYERCNARLVLDNGGVALPRRPLLSACQELMPVVPAAVEVVDPNGSMYYAVAGTRVVGRQLKDLAAARSALDGAAVVSASETRAVVEVRDGVVYAVPYAAGGTAPLETAGTNQIIDLVKHDLEFGLPAPAPAPAAAVARASESPAAKKRLYDYLATVEANHHCGGFCKAGPALWVPDPAMPEGACAPYVGLKFLTVKRQGDLLFWIAAVTGTISMICLARI